LNSELSVKNSTQGKEQVTSTTKKEEEEGGNVNAQREKKREGKQKRKEENPSGHKRNGEKMIRVRSGPRE